MPYIHQEMAAGRWFTLTLAEQLANVGSEFERVISWRQKNRLDYEQNAFDRMLELLDLTIQDKRWHNHRLKELTRLREVLCEELTKKPLAPQFLLNGLSKYFWYFGYAARATKISKNFQ